MHPRHIKERKQDEHMIGLQRMSETQQGRTNTQLHIGHNVHLQELCSREVTFSCSNRVEESSQDKQKKKRKSEIERMKSMDMVFPGGGHWTNRMFEECTLTLDCRKQLCRLCASVIDVATYIFNKTGNELSLADKINISLPVTVNTTDDLPKQLCSSCVWKVNECYEFSTLCLKAKEYLVKKTEEYFNSRILDTAEDEGKEPSVSSEIASYKCPLCIQGNVVVCDLGNEEISKIKTYFHDEVDIVSKCIEITSETESNEGYNLCSGSILNTEDNDLHKKADIYYNNESTENTLINPIQFTNTNPFMRRYNTLIAPEHNMDKSKSKIENCTSVDPRCVTDRSQFTTEEKFKLKVETIFICRICGELLQTVDLSYHHTLTHVEKDYYPCILCDSNFTFESQLENHFKDHTYEHKNNQKVTQHLGVSTQCFECSECNLVFFTKKRFTFHRQLHERAGCGYQCEPCREEFEDETQLYHHVCSVHDNEKLFFCDQCGKSFITRNRLALHKHEHSGDWLFRCLHCGHGFNSKVSMLEHAECHKISKLFKCFHCDASFTCRTKLIKHVELQHYKLSGVGGQVCYKCSECFASFPNAAQALKHGEGHTDFHVDSTAVFIVFKCEYCELCFSCREDWKHHLKKHSGTSPYVCLECNLFFETFYNVMEHKKKHVKLIDPNHDIFPVPIVFLCEFCEKYFKQWEYLYIHQQTHLSEKKTEGTPVTNAVERKYIFEDQSNLCDSFSSQNELSKHRRQNHLQKKQYKCEECGKVLANPTGLVIHRRLHTGEMPFVCDVCGKAFRQSTGMYIHRRTHTKECPYRCDLCNQAFNVKGDLDNHRRSKHTKERPFKCLVCGKSFLTSGVYYQHKVLHTGIRKYKCMHCEKAFSRWNALRLHTRTHTGEKPHICSVCNRGFSQKGDMRKHMRTQHNTTL